MMDLEKYRQPWESDEHWVFRKEFIKTHRERFPNEDRLLCLAQVFANVELLGCSYPEPVMAQINELSREIQQVEKLRDKRSERTVVKFVKDTSEGASRYSGKRSAPFDNKETKKTTTPQTSRDYPSVGSFNRVGAADLFDSKPSGDPVASYYTVKGASQSQHQGEKPLPPSLVSYNTIKFVAPIDNIGNYCNEGERVSPSSEPMIVDCSPDPEKSKQVDFGRYNVIIGQVPSYNTVKTQNKPSQDTIKTAELRKTPNIKKLIPKPLESKFSELSIAKLELEKTSKETNKVHFLDILLSKCGLKRDFKYKMQQEPNKKPKFIASLMIDNVLCGIGAGNSKKESRVTACLTALSLLSSNEFKVIPVEEGKPEFKLVAAADPKFNSEKALQPFHPNIFTPVISLPEPMIVDCSPESEKSSEASFGRSTEVPRHNIAQTLEEESNDAIKKKKQGKKPANWVKYFPTPRESTFSKLAALKLELGEQHKDTNELHFLDILLSKTGFKRNYIYEPLRENNTKFKFIASLNIETVLCGKAAGETKKESQLTACRRALSLLSLSKFKVIPIEEGKPNLKLVSSDDPNFSAEKCLEPFHPNIFTPVVRLGKNGLPAPTANSLPNTRRVTNQGTFLGQNSNPPMNISGLTSKFHQLSTPGMKFQGQTSKTQKLSRPGMKFQGKTAKFQQTSTPLMNFQRGIQRSITPQATTTQMILVDDTMVNPGSNDISMLMNSCSFSRTPVTFNFEDVKINEQPMKRCTVIISGQTEGIGDSETKQLSKSIASKAAIKNLQRRFYTIQIKQNISSSAPQINKHQVINQVVSEKAGTSSGEAAIDSSNVGFRMMQLMGWKGKGIGKGEKGIETPVCVQDVYQREGLGFTNDGSMSSQFKNKMEKIILQFAKSNFSNDIKFSPDFTKDERKYIHSLADKYHLKTASKGGKGSGRFLVLSHKLNPQQLLHNLLTTGGSNEKYTLILPGQARGAN